MSKKQKRAHVQTKEQEKVISSRNTGVSNSEMIEFLKSQGYLLEQIGNENEDVKVA